MSALQSVERMSASHIGRHIIHYIANKNTHYLRNDKIKLKILIQFIANTSATFYSELLCQLTYIKLQKQNASHLTLTFASQQSRSLFYEHILALCDNLPNVFAVHLFRQRCAIIAGIHYCLIYTRFHSLNTGRDVLRTFHSQNWKTAKMATRQVVRWDLLLWEVVIIGLFCAIEHWRNYYSPSTILWHGWPDERDGS